MPDEHRRRVRIAVVCPDRKVVDVVKADVVNLVEKNLKANVTHQAAIESRPRGLLDDQNANRNTPVRPVASKIGMHVRDEGRKVLGSVTIGNDNAKSLHEMLLTSEMPITDP